MNRTATVLLTALAPVSWGTTYAVTTEFLPADRPLFTGMMRALPAGLVLLALARVLPRGVWWGKAAVLGALNIGAFFPLLFLSAYRLPGGMAAVVGSVGPLIVVGLSAVLLGQRPTARSVLTGLVAAFGVSLVVLKAAGALDVVGVAAAFTSAASMSAYTVLTKRWGRPDGVGPLALTAWQLTMRRPAHRAPRPPRRGRPARPRRPRGRRLPLPRAGEHGGGVLALVPRHRPSHRHPGHLPRPTVPADRRGRRLGGTRTDPDAGATGGHGAGLRGDGGGPAGGAAHRRPDVRPHRGQQPRGFG